MGAGVWQLPYYEYIKKYDLEIVAIDRDEKAEGVPIADIHLNCSTYDGNNILKRLTELEKTHEYCGILPSASGPALFSAAQIAEHYNLNGPRANLVRISTEKSVVRTFCKSHDLLCPKGEKITTNGNVNISVLEFPLIIKPDLPIIGKKSISVIQEASGQNVAVKEAIAASANDFALIEEYINGYDIFCFFYISEGNAKSIAYFDEFNVLDENNCIVGLGGGAPSSTINSTHEKNIQSYMDKIAKVFWDSSALVLLSLRITQDGDIYLIEIHVDLGGKLFHTLSQYSMLNMYNLYDLAVDVILGYPLSINKSEAIPTLLIEKKYVQNKQERGKLIQDYYLFQEGSVQNNMKYLAAVLRDQPYLHNSGIS